MMYNNKKTEKMKTEKMTYEKPTVQKVEFDFKTRIAASACVDPPVMDDWGDSACLNP
jgi:hypothetical protein